MNHAFWTWMIHIHVNPKHFTPISSFYAELYMSVFVCMFVLDIYGSIQCQNHNSSFTLDNPFRVVCTFFSSELDLLLPIKSSAYTFLTQTRFYQCWIELSHIFICVFVFHLFLSFQPFRVTLSIYFNFLCYIASIAIHDVHVQCQYMCFNYKTKHWAYTHIHSNLQ